MVKYHDSAVEAADIIAFIKLVHVVDGIYLWEYFSTLWFEWSFITGKQPYRWTIWVYAATRLATLLNVLISLIGYNIRKEMDCQLWIHSEYIIAYTAFALGSFFMILRITAIWDAHKWILAASLGAWLTNIAFMIRGLIMTSAYWDPTLLACASDDGRKTLANATTIFCSELFLLLVMIIGLVRQRDHYIGRLLFHQGLVWLIVATVAEVPAFVLLFLNLNEPWNVMFQPPGLIVMTICVTRMHRGLNKIRDYQSGPEIPTMNLGEIAIPSKSTYSNDRRLESQAAVRVAISTHAWQPSDKSDGTTWEPTSTTVASFQGTTAA